MAVNSRSMLEGECFLRGLTFDMRGGRKRAKPACGRPLDGRVRPHSAPQMEVEQPDVGAKAME